MLELESGSQHQKEWCINRKNHPTSRFASFELQFAANLLIGYFAVVSFSKLLRGK
jgi:hypothetical protein